MAEFCKSCFLKLNPELTEEDLIMIKGAELCEGCGKIVNESVLEVKDIKKTKVDRTEKQEKTIYKFLYNHLTGEPEIYSRHILKETKTSYYIEDVPCKRGGTRISKQWINEFLVNLSGNEYPVMYSFDISENYKQYLNMLIDYLDDELDTKIQNLDKVKYSYVRQCELNERKIRK